MVHNEIHAIDLGIIAAYLIAMVVIGVVVVKKVQSTDDYYCNDRDRPCCRQKNQELG